MGPWLGQVRLAGAHLGQYAYDDSAGYYGDEINAACYTCADPSGVASPQYGIDAGSAANLQNQGWDCRRDDCASGYGDNSGYGMMGRIPLARGLGRRALDGSGSTLGQINDVAIQAMMERVSQQKAAADAAAAAAAQAQAQAKSQQQKDAATQAAAAAAQAQASAAQAQTAAKNGDAAGVKAASDAADKANAMATALVAQSTAPASAAAAPVPSGSSAGSTAALVVGGVAVAGGILYAILK